MTTHGDTQHCHLLVDNAALPLLLCQRAFRPSVWGSIDLFYCILIIAG